MPKALKVGIVGCGKIAHIDHVPGYLGAAGADVVALHDVKKRQMAKLSEAFDLQAQTYTNWAKFLASGIDAISICTPNCFHCPQTIDALRAGLHVLCEKPMAATPAETTRMIAAAKKAGKVLQINQTLRYLPVYVKIAELVQSGAIGKPIHVRCIRAGGSTPDKGWSPGARWFVSKQFHGGLVLDIGVHMADMMQWAVGEITEVAAYVDTRIKNIDVPDNVSALMRFKNGATGVLELSWTMPVGAGVLEIYGTEGTLRQGFSKQNPIEIMMRTKDGKVRTLRPKPRKRLRNSQERFLDAIRGRSASPSPGEVGREAIALCDAIVRSGASGRFVKVQKF